MPVYIGQPAIDSVLPESKAFVVNAEQVQNGRMQVVDTHAVLHRFVSNIVCSAVRDASFHSTAG